MNEIIKLDLICLVAFHFLICYENTEYARLLICSLAGLKAAVHALFINFCFLLCFQEYGSLEENVALHLHSKVISNQHYFGEWNYFGAT